ncbi:MAG: group II intron reverse transcriptase/maturase [Nitrosopumilus sp.]|nr:group II intron reverse transcriptase/maturase [Nitrosopumilus sp.]
MSDEADRPVVPKKPTNKARRVAESAEGRSLAKENPNQPNTDRTQRRPPVHRALERIREAARKDRRLRFTALLHHIYDIDRLRSAFQSLRRKASAGVDGVTWEQYAQDLEENLQDLSARIKRGAYRARPVRRVRIPKDGGRERLLGIPAVEDKLVQRATVEVLQCIYEQDFAGFSYGFRPGRSAHKALDAVSVGIRKRKVGWVLDADIRGFFDTLDHGWLVKFLEHRIGDKRVLRLIAKWLKAGVLEDGKRIRSEVGAVQGGSISPLLANVYLHYALDLWTQRWRNRSRGDVIVVRYADDFLVGFQYREEAERYLVEVTDRFARFGLELHCDKTRLVQFGRFATKARKERGQGKPETFNFLGFTHACGRSRRGWFAVKRWTRREAVRRALCTLYQQLRARMHDPIPEQGRYLASVARGHFNYYGLPGNAHHLRTFRRRVTAIWRNVLSRRSQRGRISWSRIEWLAEAYLPPAHLKYTDPDGHLASSIRGRSPVR